MSFDLTGEIKLPHTSVQLLTVFDMAGLDMVVKDGKLHSIDPAVHLALDPGANKTVRVTGQFDTREEVARQRCTQLGLALEADGIDFRLQLMAGDSVLLSIEAPTPAPADQ